MGLEPTNLLTASQALYQLSYAPEGDLSGYQSPSDDLEAPFLRQGARESKERRSMPVLCVPGVSGGADHGEM
jgi:hypothetical protein